MEISDLTTTELVCSETYFRTIWLCEEQKLRCELSCKVAMAGLSAPVNHTSTVSSHFQPSLDKSCSSCCSLRELQSGECKHAAECLDILEKQQDGDSFLSNITERLARARQRISNSFAKLDEHSMTL